MKDKAITDLIDKKKQLQPNSIDLTVKQIQYAHHSVRPMISEKKKTMPLFYEVPVDSNGFFSLKAGKNYQIIFNEKVKVPKDTIAFITHRSSLNRMGVFICSGLYDDSFQDRLGAMLRTWMSVRIKKNTRIATIYFLKADSHGAYKGQYQKHLLSQEEQK